MQRSQRLKPTKTKERSQATLPAQAQKVQEEPIVIKWPEPVERIESLRTLPAVGVLEKHGIPRQWLIQCLRQAAIQMMMRDEVDQATGLPRPDINRRLREVRKLMAAISTILNGGSLPPHASVAWWDTLIDAQWALEEIRVTLSEVAAGKRAARRPSYAPIWKALVDVVDRIKARKGEGRITVWAAIVDVFKAAFPYLNVNRRTIEVAYLKAKAQLAHHPASR